jgi:hypothetical protein
MSNYLPYFTCDKCGGKLVKLAQGNRSPQVACLTCLATNDEKEVRENSAGLVPGTPSPGAADELSRQARAAGVSV